MSKNNQRDNHQQNRDREALKLMSYVCQSSSSNLLSKELGILGYELVENYAVRNVAFPKYCSVVVQSVNNPSELYVLNRGISRFHFNLFGFLEELSDVVDITRSQVVQGAEELRDIIDKIKRDFDITELTIVGHSRGALTAIYNADNEELDPLTKPNTRIVAVDSPGVNNFRVNNTNFIEYKALPNFLNSWGGLVSGNTLLVSPAEINYNISYLEYSNSYHDIDNILENLENSRHIMEWYDTGTAYNKFLSAGGKKDWFSSIFINGGKFLTNCNPSLASFIKTVSRYIDPDSYQNSLTCPANEPFYSTELTLGGEVGKFDFSL